MLDCKAIVQRTSDELNIVVAIVEDRETCRAECDLFTNEVLEPIEHGLKEATTYSNLETTVQPATTRFSQSSSEKLIHQV